MVIPTGPFFERRNKTLLDHESKTDDSNGTDRHARLQHKFLVLRKLGQGTYGKVQLALNKETNREVAIKTIKKARIESEEDMLRIRREIHIMKSIRHPYIIHIHEVFETRQKIVIVMQYASGGELYDYLGCHNSLPEDEARRIFRQIASAIYYCHKNKICHRDLKLENILLDEEGNAQIADFGLSNIFDDRRRMNTFCGSPLYASPEIVKGTPYKGPEVDCWSLGVLLYTLIYGTMPFDGRNFKDLVSQISEGRYEEPANVSSASSLIRRLLTPEISKRATIIDVCNDSWVNQGYNESLLKVAEKMAYDTVIKTRILGSTKFLSERSSKNGPRKLSLQAAPTNVKLQNVVQNNRILDNSETLNSSNGTTPQTIPFYEQILNYDVSFVINKLLSAVETSIKNSKSETHHNLPQKLITNVKENGIPSLKSWSKNGETIVESAYVIPIFEVTSVVPKPTKNVQTESSKENSKQYLMPNSIHNGLAQNSTITTKKENKCQLNIGKEDIVNEKKTIIKSKELFSKNLEHSTKVSDLPKVKVTEHGGSVLVQKSSNITNETINLKNTHPVKKIINQENSFSRVPSIKAKRANENYLFTSKHLGPFFRTTNHALTLARLFSLNCEKLVLNKLKLPERKKKPPGKIVIPATFDPSITPIERVQEERKQIVVFPTISVSENKEKIEKKIEKIKKAALNMKLIRRSNSKNRLKIQKFLRSQAKKMQDLICDEQRSIAGSMEQLNRCEIFPSLSESYYNFEKGNLTPFNLKQQNKKINFIHANEENFNNIPTFNFTKEEIIKKNVLRNLSIGRGSSSELFPLTKSKSDSRFPSEFVCSNTSYDSCFTSNPSFIQHILNIQLNDNNGRLLRSASDSEGLKCFKNAFEIDFSKESFENSDSDFQLSQFDVQNHIIDESIAHFTKASKPKETNFWDHLSESAQDTEHLNNNSPYTKTVLLNRYYIENNKESNFLPRSFSVNTLNDFQKEKIDFSIIKCLPSAAFVENDTYKLNCNNVNSVFTNQEQTGVVDRAEAFSMAVNAIFESRRRPDERNRLMRRNTLSCIADTEVFSYRNMNKLHSTFGNTEEKFTSDVSEVDDYLWTAFKQQLLSHSKNETKISNSSDTYSSSFREKINGETFVNNKSIDNLNLRANINSSFYEDLLCSSSASALKSSERSAFLRRILQDYDKDIDFLPTHRNRTKSLSEDVFSNEERGDILRKLSLAQGSATGQNSQKKSPFLSKFLNDLENREQHSNVKESPLNHRRYVRNSLPPGKRPKQEKRSQSFLQMMSLKRIQEAEKELDRVERNPIVNAEEEENTGSLLEALKTHGYRGVISQLFQGQEDDSLDTFNIRNPRGQFLGRKIIPDVSRYNLMYYDALPQLTPNTYDVFSQFSPNVYDVLPQYSSNVYDPNDLDVLNGITVSSAYEMYPGIRQNSPKQFVYDWLTSTQNSDYRTPFTLEPDSSLELDEHFPVTENKGPTHWGKEESKSIDKETSSSESFDAPQDQQAGVNESGKTKYCFLNPTNHSKGASSTSEDEKEESVQDRIWRKSFYSRFNNSVLSRKERSSFLESEFSPESRAGFSGSRSPSLKGSLRERRDSANWNGYNKDIQKKRIHSPRKYSPASDSSSTDCMTTRLSESSKHNSFHNDLSNENLSMATKVDDIEPDH